MEPPRKHDPETEELEDVDDSDVELIDDDEPSARDTIPPEGLITTHSIPPGDPEVEDALLDEQLGDIFTRMRRESTPPPPAPIALSEDELEAQREAEFDALLESKKKQD